MQLQTLMNLWRKHWFDIGALLALPLSAWLYWHRASLPPVQLILGVSLVTLLVHQVEEYRWPGYFPGMLNAAVYGSAAPDRYPLNTQTSLLINVPLGWVTYALAALLAQHALWLGIATIVISLGNVMAHTVFFNLKGRTWYNPGQATALLLFLPLAGWFTHTVLTQHLASPAQWVAGVVLGLALNFLCIIKPIDWLADERTPFQFERRQLRLVDRVGE